MHYLAKNLGLPLLTKELVEQSARKRTYVIRVVYALSLYAVTLWVFQHQLGAWDNVGLTALGRGRDLYLSLAWLQFVGVYVFLPAMTCSTLTSEKERDTLGLLLLTKLRPWTIVFEKLFSRLVPMAMFVLLSMPLLAVAYSLGGLEFEDILKLLVVLLATAFQVGSFAVLCSAWFRTTAGAFLATYLLGSIALLMTAISFCYLLQFWFELFFGHFLSNSAFEWLQTDHDQVPHAMLLLLGPAILNGGELLGINQELPTQTLFDCLLMSIPLLGTSFVSLLVARVVLWQRAFVQPKNVLTRVFRALDAFFQRANQNKITRGIVLIRESVALPFYHPISWRETTKKSLGTTRYLIRMLLILEIPVLFIVLWPADEYQIRTGLMPSNLAEGCLWIAAILVLIIQTTGLIGTERSRQTLDVLLTIPLESREIIAQKFSCVWRMIIMLWIPFATIYLAQISWSIWVGNGSRFNSDFSDAISFKVLRSLLSISVYLPTVAWFGFYQGLKYRSQTQAIFASMFSILALCVVPPVAAWLVQSQLGDARYGLLGAEGLSVKIACVSPIAIQFFLHGNFGLDWVILILHFIGAGCVNLWYYQRSRQVFAHCVGRNDGVDGDEIEVPVAPLSTDERMARLRRGSDYYSRHKQSDDASPNDISR